ncbi:hypothetical protein HT031_005082 [Scenedesmus sp. PABB004]|nr:hypothetical protein HT031_005082 [Scenedesmus sp. PABB004]
MAVSEQGVRDCLSALWGVEPPPAPPSGASPRPALRLHPRVDAVHPLGEAHSAAELEAALAVWRALLPGVALALDDVLLSSGGDAALATGYQHVPSHLARVRARAARGRGRASGARGAAVCAESPAPTRRRTRPAALAPVAAALPAGLRAAAADLLPAPCEGRVHTTVRLRLGKSDAGEPVVTHLELSCSLASALLPHVRLQPWQAELVARWRPHALAALSSCGALAALAEDVGTSAGAAWGAGGTLLAPLAAEARVLLAAATTHGAAAARHGRAARCSAPATAAARRPRGARSRTMDKRGPKIGDAASLWNFTPSPGWTKEECLILKLCIMKHGVGQWVAIQATGLLPGKLVQQLNGATQRLLGQQSLAAFSGLRVDVDRVRADNDAKADAVRKNGLVIWSGPNPTKEMRLQWHQEVKAKYELTAEQQREAEAALEELAAAAAQAARPAAGAPPAVQPLPADLDIMECDADQLPTQQKQLLVCALHARLAQLLARAAAQPGLAAQATYVQQAQQAQPPSWVLQGLPAVAAAAGAAAGVADSDGSDAKENRPGRANLLLRPGGRVGKGGGGKGSGKAGSRSAGGKAPGAAKKRARGGRGPQLDDGDDDDGAPDSEASFLQRAAARRGGGRRGGDRGGGDGGGMLQELMQVALEAGVAQLGEMGYSRAKALDALRECNCDVEAAVEFLATACC